MQRPLVISLLVFMACEAHGGTSPSGDSDAGIEEAGSDDSGILSASSGIAHGTMGGDPDSSTDDGSSSGGGAESSSTSVGGSTGGDAGSSSSDGDDTGLSCELALVEGSSVRCECDGGPVDPLMCSCSVVDGQICECGGMPAPDMRTCLWPCAFVDGQCFCGGYMLHDVWCSS